MRHLFTSLAFLLLVGSTEINTENLPDKLYFYQIGNTQQTVTGKLILVN